MRRAQEHSVQVVDAQGKLLRGFITADGSWRLPLAPEAVEPLYLTILKVYEDRRFDRHPGIDPLALARAVRQWIGHGRVISGASTLTMQTARLLQPRPRTLAGKLIEMLRALQLEWHYNKNEILGFYLTLAPFGGNLQGLRAASLAYLDKEPRHLTPAEAALLVALPQAPSRLRPDRFPKRARAARDKVLERMVRRGVLSQRQAAEARREPLSGRRYPMPFHAPHLARRLVAASPESSLHRTSIDGNLQRALEALARQQRARLDPRANLAVLVVDNRTYRVIVYIGSADFFDSRRSGQIDMVRAVRSPGSTLKPFIYGLGFEDLIIHPETLIDDVPTRFGNYAPTNFRHTYFGQVTVREALQRSLNIPAVKVLERVGPSRVAARLRAAGITLRWSEPRQPPGLPLVLGGVGTTLEDLVKLFAGIANGGQISPLRFALSDSPDTRPSQRLLNEEASWYLRRILMEAPPPRAVVAAGHARDSRLRAHKTGTSYGFRDAWALGFDGAYTVGVWVGRPDGSPSPGRYGRNTAAPLLFRVFNLLPRREANLPGSPPERVFQVANGGLPDRLKRFRRDPGDHEHYQRSLAIAFPVDGSRVVLAIRDEQLEDLPLVARGGKRPLRWLVNGRPVSVPGLRRQAFWSPDGEGAARVTVVDSEGQTATAKVWVAAEAAGAVDYGLFRY
jgi:penicillin-binding protein 1C